MKKLLMFVLVAVMVAGFAVTAFAAAGEIAPKAFSDISGNKAEAELTLLAAMGVYSGEAGLGGAVKPGDPITRAQFCKVVVSAMGRASTAQALMGLKPTFKDDIQTWAWGYVNVAVYTGIINGYQDGTFKGNNPVTYAEAVTMLIRAVSGHVAQVGPGVWPYNYLFYGVDNGFTGSVDVGFANLPATRGDIARMLYATMRIEKVNKDGEDIAGTAVLSGRMISGAVTDYAADHSTITIGSTVYGLTDKVYVVGASDYEGLRNLAVTAIKTESGTAGKIFFIAVGESANVVRGEFKQLLDTNNDTAHKKDTIELADGTKVAYSENTGVSVTLNRVSGKNQGNLTAGDELVITLGDDGKAVNVVALSFDRGEDYIDGFTASKTSPKTDTHIDLANGHDYNISADCLVTINGAAASRDGLKVDDAILIATKGATGTEPISVRVARQSVEGTVKTSSTTYTSSGTILRVTIEKKTGGTETYILDNKYLSLPAPGAVVKLGFNADGELYVPIGYETVTPYVLVTGYTLEGSGHRTVTVDQRGQSVTYRCDGFDFSGGIGGYYLLDIDMSDGSLDAATLLTVSGNYEVLAVDAAHGTMTVKDGGGVIYFVSNDDATVYKVTTSGKVYLGIAGLRAGNHVKANASASSAGVFELINP